MKNQLKIKPYQILQKNRAKNLMKVKPVKKNRKFKKKE